MKHKVPVYLVFLFVCGSLLLMSCIRPASNAPVPTVGANVLNGTKWQLVSLEQQPALTTAAVTAEFSDAALTGSAGCNTYSATYRLNDTMITLSPAAATRMACVDEQQMAQETTYLEDLETITQFQLVNEQLELLNSQGEVVMVFEHQ